MYIYVTSRVTKTSKRVGKSCRNPADSTKCRRVGDRRYEYFTGMVGRSYPVITAFAVPRGNYYSMGL